MSPAIQKDFAMDIGASRAKSLGWCAFQTVAREVDFQGKGHVSLSMPHGFVVLVALDDAISVESENGVFELSSVFPNEVLHTGQVILENHGNDKAKAFFLEFIRSD